MDPPNIIGVSQMLVERTSNISGKTTTREIDVTEDQLVRYENREGLVQDIMPDISPDDREFIMTGITPEEWDEVFPDE